MKRSSFPPAVLGALALVICVLAWFGYQWFAAGRAVAAERSAVLLAVTTELDRRPPDSGELSQLMARIKKIEDYTTAPDLLQAQARIEFARDRVARAAALFLPIASRPGADPADRGFAAEILLRQHAAGLPDRAAAVAVLEDTISHASAAYASTQAPGDLLHAWLAALRLSDKARLGELGERIQEEHPGTAAAAMVALTSSFSVQMPRRAVDAVRDQLTAPLPELEAMLALVLLQAQDLDGALATVEPLLARAPGVVEVRQVAAALFHVCALSSAADGTDRGKWLRRRDAQLDWLVQHADPADARRPNWVSMRRQR